MAGEEATLSVKELGNAISLAILGFGFFCLYFYLYVESGVITSTDRYVIILSSIIFLAAVSVLFFSLILKRQSEKPRRRHKISAVYAGILSCLTIAILLNPNGTPKLFGGYSPGYIGSDKNQVYTVNLLNPCLNEGVMSAKSPFAYFPITTGACYYNKHYPKAMEDEQSRRYLFALDGDWLEHYDLYVDIKKGQTSIRDRLRLLTSLNAAAYVRLSQPGVDLNSRNVKKLREDFGIDDGATLESLTRPYIDLIESDLSDEALMEKVEDDFPIESIDSFYTTLLFESKNHSIADKEIPSRGYLVKLNSYSKTLNMLEEGPIKTYIMNMGEPQ